MQPLKHHDLSVYIYIQLQLNLSEFKHHTITVNCTQPQERFYNYIRGSKLH